MQIKEVAIIGSGSWATALVKIFTNNRRHVHWWVRNDETAEHIVTYHHNPIYLSSVEFKPERISVNTNLEEVINSVEVVILAIPSIFLSETLNALPRNIFENKYVISSIKGIVSETNELIHDYLIREFNIILGQYGVISGPCHAEEIGMERLSFLTVAGKKAKFVTRIATIINCRYVQTSTTDDVVGTTYAGILKNIYSIVHGIYLGIGSYGDNFMAVFICNAIKEMQTFLQVASTKEQSVLDSVYLGDLLATSYSQFSRNRFFGTLIGKNYSVKYAIAEMNMVAEGYNAVKCVKKLNETYMVEMPILDAAYRVLYESIAPKIEMKILAQKFK